MKSKQIITTLLFFQIFFLKSICFANTLSYYLINNVSLSPTNNDNDVSTSINSLTLTFDEDVFLGTGSVTLNDLSDPISTPVVINVSSGSISVNGTSATITLPISLNSGRCYDVIVSNTLFQSGSNVFFEGFSAGEWTFQTSGATAPKAISSPLNNATNVDSDTDSLTLIFDQNIFLNEGTLTINTTNIIGSTPTVFDENSSEITINENIVTVSLSSPLGVGNCYEVSISNTLFQSCSGYYPDLSLGDWTFQTSGVTNPTAILSPLNNATNVASNTSALTLTFNQNIFLDDGTLTINATNVSGSTPNVFDENSSEITIDENVVTVYLSSPLGSGNCYQILVSNNLFQSCAGLSFSEIINNQWTFETTGASGCGSTLEVNDLETNQFLVFPNPFEDSLSIEMPTTSKNEKIKVSIFDSNQKLIYETDTKNHESNVVHLTLKTHLFNSGIYFLNLKSETESIFKKIVKY